MKWKNVIFSVISYLLVAVLASTGTLYAVARTQESTKLDQISAIIQKYFIGEVDEDALTEGAAEGMVDALGDRWSYYLPASERQTYEDSVSNSYTGIGVTILREEDDEYLTVHRVEPNGGAAEAGIEPGDLLTAVNGTDVKSMTTSEVKAMIQGDENTTVSITLLRGEETLTLEVERRTIVSQVAQGRMLEGDIGYISLSNFNSNSSSQTIAVVDELREQGAKGLIFDLRFNPGGYKDELVKILDYLLPEGDLFHSETYDGKTETDTSDAACVELPMAVLVNGESYSAAEFFAAALREYDWATVVGEQTCGKGYFQAMIYLSDGSGINLSVGKYTTPKGVSLVEAGGLTPDLEIDIDDTLYARIYSGVATDEEDIQLQAAIENVTQKIG